MTDDRRAGAVDGSATDPADGPDGAATSAAPSQRRRATDQPSAPRVWRGISRDARVEARRGRLLAAGLEVFGTVGGRDATVSLVCQTAGLTQRYFYESFPTMTSLLTAVFETVTERQHEQMASAALEARASGGDLHDAARAALQSYFRGLQADPRIARVQLLEVLGGDGSTQRCYQTAIRRAADLVLILGDVREVSRPAVPRLLALGLIGAVVEIATMWLLAGFSDSLESVVGSALLIFDAVIAAEFAPG